MATRPVVMVTGAAGFLGGAVCGLLESRGTPVLALDRETRSDEGRPIVAADSRASAESAMLYQPSRCIASPRPAISAQPRLC